MIRTASLALAACFLSFSPAAAAPDTADPAPQLAAAPPVVDVELVLAVDVSWSMDIQEQELQREGYVAALRHPDVLAAIQRGDWQRIALTYVEWAGHGLNRVIVPWTIIENNEDAEAFAAKLERAPIARMRRTSISSILTKAAAMFDNGIDGMRRVIDVSGDGPNNMGLVVTAARDEVLSQGIVINGLPIMIKRSNPGGFFHLDELDIYYEDCVIGGFGAFMITVNSADKFAEAIRRKIILEIARAPDDVVPATWRAPGSPPRIDCTVGEQQWQRWRRFDRW
ncbi:MAG: DUF1194 domain-containing protein [Pseudomonadota bacterium]